MVNLYRSLAHIFHQVDSEIWSKSLSNFNFVCPITRCMKNCSISGIRKHVMRTHGRSFIDEKFNTTTMRCGVTTCEQHCVDLAIDGFIKHVKSKHPEVIFSVFLYLVLAENYFLDLVLCVMLRMFIQDSLFSFLCALLCMMSCSCVSRRS